MSAYRIVRLGPGERERARRLFCVIADVFEQPRDELPDAYLDELLGRPDFWIMAAFSDENVVGGVTAHTLPLTRAPKHELFVYDVAVDAAHRRRGVGRLLIEALRASAAAAGVFEAFVAADNEDEHALDFYRALDGAAAAVTIFSFG